jgi:hypothetical protein
MDPLDSWIDAWWDASVNLRAPECHLRQTCRVQPTAELSKIPEFAACNPLDVGRPGFVQDFSEISSVILFFLDSLPKVATAGSDCV